jgi:hypothetical protein
VGACLHVFRAPQALHSTTSTVTVPTPAQCVQFSGDEEPGCMESGSAADGTFTVTGVGRSTFVCSAGPCLAFSPLFNPEGGHAHAH